MCAPSRVVYCAKCGDTILVGKVGDVIHQPIKVRPCRRCLTGATREGFKAGRLSAITELCIEVKSND